MGVEGDKELCDSVPRSDSYMYIDLHILDLLVGTFKCVCVLALQANSTGFTMYKRAQVGCFQHGLINSQIPVRQKRETYSATDEAWM